MAVTVVGSIAFDAVKTPFGEREKMLGGAAVQSWRRYRFSVRELDRLQRRSPER